MKPKENQVWRHIRNNTLYKVLLLTNEAATKDTFPVTVVYVDYDGKIWSRPLSEWLESMELVVE
jgi:hypothetical protein